MLPELLDINISNLDDLYRNAVNLFWYGVVCLELVTRHLLRYEDTDYLSTGHVVGCDIHAIDVRQRHQLILMPLKNLVGVHAYLESEGSRQRCSTARRCGVSLRPQTWLTLRADHGPVHPGPPPGFP